MATANWQSLGVGDNVRDFRHAARIFGSNDFARAPKYKFSFYVVLTINPNATADNFSRPPDFKTELSYLVKNVELPKFELDVQELNQYNRKVLVQRQIKYNPITIKFHDDNSGTLRDFWQSYYNYYYMDGRYTDNDFKIDDKYKNRKAGGNSKWGLDTNAKAPYLTKIDIYSMYHGQAEKITLESPLIISFNHDSHDYAENQGLLEATMSVRYTGVRYESGINAQYGIPGFGQSAPEAYDTEYSNLTNGSGYQYDPKSGQQYDPLFAGDVINPNGLGVGTVYNPNPLYNLQNTNFNNFSPTVAGYITDAQLAAILVSNSQLPINAGYAFPSANPVPAVFSEYGPVPLQGPLATSNGVPVPAPGAVTINYAPGSWQAALYQKGYSPDQITSASRFLATAKLSAGTNIQDVAAAYIRNSNSPTVTNIATPVFGQPATRPTNIDFSNPTISTKPVYNSQDWRYNLSQQGYSKSEINAAEKFLATVKVSSAADLTTVASNYIKNSKNKGLPGNPSSPVRQKLPILGNQSNLKGPYWNPLGGGPDGKGTGSQYTL